MAKNILAYGYSPMFETSWIGICKTEGMCYSLNFYAELKEKYGVETANQLEIRTYHATKYFTIYPSRYDNMSQCDLRYKYCPGCFKPIYTSDAIRLNYLLGHREPKRQVKRLDFEGLVDF